MKDKLLKEPDRSVHDALPAQICACQNLTARSSQPPAGVPMPSPAPWIVPGKVSYSQAIPFAFNAFTNIWLFSTGTILSWSNCHT